MAQWLKHRFTHTCTVERNTPTQSASGELQDDWDSIGTMAGRFVEERERIASPSEGFVMLKTHSWLCDTGITSQGTAIAVDDRITSILDPDDGSIDAGPFGIEEILHRRDIKGAAHHLELKLERVEAT